MPPLQSAVQPQLSPPQTQPEGAHPMSSHSSPIGQPRVQHPAGFSVSQPEGEQTLP